jgi:hypothetical protein
MLGLLAGCSTAGISIGSRSDAGVGNSGVKVGGGAGGGVSIGR